METDAIIGLVICLYLMIHLAAPIIGLMDDYEYRRTGWLYPFLTPLDIYQCSGMGVISTIIVYVLYFVSTPIWAICTLIYRLWRIIKGD